MGIPRQLKGMSREEGAVTTCTVDRSTRRDGAWFIADLGKRGSGGVLGIELDNSGREKG